MTNSIVSRLSVISTFVLIATLGPAFGDDLETLQKLERQYYAEKLHKAKKWVRDQKQWSSPYYWATFVLVDPN